MQPLRNFSLEGHPGALSPADMPAMFRVRQAFPRPVEGDIEAAVRREIAPFLSQVARGQRIAITGSSRGIANLPLVLRTCAHALREHGAEPFVVPGMGSHGGATAPGQVAVLEHGGMSEATLGCPIVSDMAVIQVGETPTGFPVYQDRVAAEADGVLVVNRVKPHTGFTECVESGICKMLVIGLGKQAGADKIHQQALRVPMGTMVLDASRIILESGKLRFIGALALVENAFKETASIRGVSLASFEHLVAEESALLAEAYGLLPRLPFDQLDLLIVDEIGKNISGAGMDTNVIGVKPDLEKPRISTIFVRGLTEESAGNAVGIGNATVMLRQVVDQIDLHATYMNAFTAKRPAIVKMPMLAESELQAMQICLSVRPDDDPHSARVAWIRNTSKLTELWASHALHAESLAHPHLEILGEPNRIRFDDGQRLLHPG